MTDEQQEQQLGDILNPGLSDDDSSFVDAAPEQNTIDESATVDANDLDDGEDFDDFDDFDDIEEASDDDEIEPEIPPLTLGQIAEDERRRVARLQPQTLAERLDDVHRGRSHAQHRAVQRVARLMRQAETPRDPPSEDKIAVLEAKCIDAETGCQIGSDADLAELKSLRRDRAVANLSKHQFFKEW